MEILEEMTKDELKRYIRGHVGFCMHPPKKSDLLFWRWENESAKLDLRSKKNIEYGSSLNMGERDRLARLFNATQDINERVSYANKMKPYEQQLKQYLDESRSIMAGERKNQKLYDSINIERQKENK